MDDQQEVSMLSDEATNIGATKIERDINWTWAYFPTLKKAEAFIKVIDEANREHSGIYNPYNTGISWGVRFR